jgi:hypothetical protein
MGWEALDNGTGAHQFRECECGPQAFLIPPCGAETRDSILRE